MEDRIRDLFNKIEESLKNNDYKSAVKFLNKAIKEARYDGVKKSVIEELNKKRIEIYDKIFIPLPSIFSSEIVWFVGLIIGIIIFYFSLNYEGLIAIIVYLIGVALILVVTHPLAHILAGRFYGIKTIKAYLGGITKLQPTVVADYLTYLSSTSLQRRNYHIAGAIVTVLTSFIILLVTLFFISNFIIRILSSIIFIAILLTDIIYSPKYSDWKRARRELKYKEIKIE